MHYLNQNNAVLCGSKSIFGTRAVDDVDCKDCLALLANPKTPEALPQKTVDLLFELRDRVMSLEAESENLKPELRTVHRGGFSQCRHMVRDLLTQILDERS